MRIVNRVRRCLKPLAIVVLTVPLTAQGQVRILQTTEAGDRVHIIDPVTNKIVGDSRDREGHGSPHPPTQPNLRQHERPHAGRGL